MGFVAATRSGRISAIYQIDRWLSVDADDVPVNRERLARGGVLVIEVTDPRTGRTIRTRVADGA